MNQSEKPSNPTVAFLWGLLCGIVAPAVAGVLVAKEVAHAVNARPTFGPAAQNVHQFPGDPRGPNLG